MSDEPGEREGLPGLADEVELIRYGEDLLVVGSSRRAVERFMRSTSMLERAKEITSRQLVPMLRLGRRDHPHGRGRRLGVGVVGQAHRGVR